MWMLRSLGRPHQVSQVLDLGRRETGALASAQVGFGGIVRKHSISTVNSASKNGAVAFHRVEGINYAHVRRYRDREVVYDFVDLWVVSRLVGRWETSEEVLARPRESGRLVSLAIAERDHEVGSDECLGQPQLLVLRREVPESLILDPKQSVPGQVQHGDTLGLFFIEKQAVRQAEAGELQVGEVVPDAIAFGNVDHGMRIHLQDRDHHISHQSQVGDYVSLGIGGFDGRSGAQIRFDNHGLGSRDLLHPPEANHQLAKFLRIDSPER